MQLCAISIMASLVPHGGGWTLADFTCYHGDDACMYLLQNGMLRTWQHCACLLLAVSCDCHMILLFCYQDYPSVGLVAKLLAQERVIPIYMITNNEAITSTYRVSVPLPPSSHCVVCLWCVAACGVLHAAYTTESNPLQSSN